MCRIVYDFDIGIAYLLRETPIDFPCEWVGQVITCVMHITTNKQYSDTLGINFHRLKLHKNKTACQFQEPN